jgi:hypothetical protein
MRSREAKASSIQRELMNMWLRLLRGSWSSIVVLPTDPSISAKDFTGPLDQLANREDVGKFLLLNGEGATISEGARLSSELQSAATSGSRVVATVDALIQSLSGVALVRDASAVLLAVRLGESRFDSVKTAIDIVGSDRIIGCAVLSPVHRQWWRPWAR